MRYRSSLAMTSLALPAYAPFQLCPTPNQFRKRPPSALHRVGRGQARGRVQPGSIEFRHIEPDNRPDWFLAISPHKKVPVMRVDDRVSLFESNAINEYLDETIAPRLHPDDPVERALNRAWTDYVPTFAESVTGMAYADDEAAYKKASDKIPVAFERVERALEKGGGPLFNGAKY